jgi:hypothetical protein
VHGIRQVDVDDHLGVDRTDAGDLHQLRGPAGPFGAAEQEEQLPAEPGVALAAKVLDPELLDGHLTDGLHQGLRDPVQPSPPRRHATIIPCRPGIRRVCRLSRQTHR